jgi:hypothetical protein
MMIRRMLALLSLLGWGGPCFAQSVDVTVTLDQPTLLVGQTTTLRVLAAIKPSVTNQADGIFSWYVDLLDNSGTTASLTATQLVMTASDNTPSTSSKGAVQGANVRAIYNTFLNLPNAGRSAPVELIAVPVKALQPGAVTFSVQHGTTTNLTYDFIVDSTNTTVAFAGGDYAAASATMTVQALTNFPISYARVTNGVVVSYAVTTGVTYRVESRTSLVAGAWSVLPNAPHNAGSAIDTNKAAPSQFYRVVAEYVY